MFTHRNSAAFSLIELLVSIVIILLLTGGALAGYTRYIDKQRLVAAAEKIEAGLRETQNMARIGYLGGCAELDYVDFSLYVHVTNGLTYRNRIHCTEDLATTYRTENIKYENLGYDFSLDSDLWSLKFYPLSNLSGAVSRTLNSTRSNQSVTFDIDQGGGIKVTYN